MKRLNRWLIKGIGAFFAFAMWSSIEAQMLLPESAVDLEMELLFNATFIQKHRIQKIEGSFSQKRDNEPIFELPGRLEIEFNIEGKLKSFLRIEKIGSRTDTTHIVFHNLNGFTVRSEKDGVGYITTMKKEVGDTLIIRAFRLPTLDGMVNASLWENELFWSYEEREIIKQRGEVERREHRNVIDLPYKTTTVHKNTLGFVEHRESTFKITQRKEKEMLSYNEYGRLSKIEKFKKGSSKWFIEFQYEDHHNLSQWDHWKREKKHSHTEVVYDDLGLIEGLVKQYLTTGHMHITKYDYAFFP